MLLGILHILEKCKGASNIPVDEENETVEAGNSGTRPVTDLSEGSIRKLEKKYADYDDMSPKYPKRTPLQPVKVSYIPFSQRMSHPLSYEFADFFTSVQLVKTEVSKTSNWGKRVAEKLKELETVTDEAFKDLKNQLSQFKIHWLTVKEKLETALQRCTNYEHMLQFILLVDEQTCKEMDLATLNHEASASGSSESSLLIQTTTQYIEDLTDRIEEYSTSIRHLRSVFPYITRERLFTEGQLAIDRTKTLILEKQELENYARCLYGEIEQKIAENREIYDSRPSMKDNRIKIEEREKIKKERRILLKKTPIST